MTGREISGVFVRESGAGLPVLLLHAFPCDSRLYDDHLASGIEGARLVCPDLPGFGKTPLAWVETLDDYADAILVLLEDAGIDDCVIGGTSMGGYVTFALLRRAPARFVGVVLADTRAGADTDEGRAAREDLARRAEAEGAEPVVAAVLPRLLAPATFESRPDVAERVRRMAAESSPGGLAAALRAMAVRPDSSDLLGRIAVPTLVVVGSQDVLTPPAEAEAMASAIPGSRLEVIEGAGHLTPVEAPAKFASALASFVAKLG